MKRRKFLQNSLTAGLGITTLGSLTAQSFSSSILLNKPMIDPFFKLSLAQWSLNRSINSKAMSPYQFAAKAKELGFSGIEYVNQLYPDVMKSKNKPAALKKFISTSNEEAAKNGVENVLIMIDDEGDLAVSNNQERKKSIENHKTWIEVAAEMDCHSIRINLFGENDPKAWKESAAESMQKLGEFAQDYNVNVLVENHGYLSSNAALVMEMLSEVNRDNCGTLPDFGNFCLEREGGQRWDASCVREYDRYLGVEELLPRAFAVSAKSNHFDANGNEIKTDYLRMLQLVKNAGYNGYIGVEYEGSELSEIAGILATKNLLLEKAKLIV
jgi:sugar phosphate isomerase/epimerase